MLEWYQRTDGFEAAARRDGYSLIAKVRATRWKVFRCGVTAYCELMIDECALSWVICFAKPVNAELSQPSKHREPRHGALRTLSRESRLFREPVEASPVYLT